MFYLFMLYVHVLWTRNAGRAGAHPTPRVRATDFQPARLFEYKGRAEGAKRTDIRFLEEPPSENHFHVRLRPPRFQRLSLS